MAFRGIDLGELWRAREWRKLSNLIDHLPRHSFYNEARANDPELADYLAGQPQRTAEERLSNWNSEVELLAMIADRVGLVATIVAATGGHKGLKVDPVRRPVTELQRARERLDSQRGRAAFESLKNRLLPRE